MSNDNEVTALLDILSTVEQQHEHGNGLATDRDRLAANLEIALTALKQIAEGCWRHEDGSACDIPMSYSAAVGTARQALATIIPLSKEVPCSTS